MHNVRTDWHIAVKRVEPVSPPVKTELEALGAEVLACGVYVHAHFFIPEERVDEVQALFRNQGFELHHEHPPACTLDVGPGYETFERRVALLGPEDAAFLAAIAEHGAQLSGGGGKPHIHVMVPEGQRAAVLEVLTHQGFSPKAE
jgi:hypothetical protein